MIGLFTHINFYLLLIAAFAAGFVDSIVGGGGLIQLPAMFLAFPLLPHPVIMGSNKFAGFSGTVVATIQFLRNAKARWKILLPAIVLSLIFAVIGARMVSMFDPKLIKPLILLLLVLVAIYTSVKKNIGMHEKPPLKKEWAFVASALTGIIIGFYDGFFGPGTGSFLIVIFVSIFGFDFLNASVSAKLINCSTNIAALSYFIIEGKINFGIAIPVAVMNICGSILGVRLAIKKGSGFVRAFFLIVVTGLILKFAYDIFFSK
ncbi:MAG TPA: TSUP family transporter [Bacteroidia bacterium]|jgi:uncharacterized membrane protein YfcA|nr:TSUP family transporter [Bacteroidia bacterium]